MQKIFLTALLFFALTLSLVAKPLSLKDCLDLALSSSPTLGSALVRIETAKAKLEEAKSKNGFSFDWKAAFGVVPNDDDGNGLGPFVRNELTFTQPLWTFGKIKTGKSAAHEGILVAQEQLSIDRAKLVFEVTKLYYLNLLALELSDLANESKDRLNKALKKAQELFDQGNPKVTQKDLAKLKIFSAKLASHSLTAATGVSMAQSALALAIGSEDPAALEFDEPRLRAPEQVQWLKLEEYISLGLEQRPELLALRHGILARQFLVKLEKSKKLPDLALVGTLKHAVAPDRTVKDQDPNIKDDFNVLNYGAAFGMRLNLGFKDYSNKVRQAQLELENIESQSRLAQKGFQLEIEKAYREAREAEERYQITRDGLKAARGWMVAETQLYQIGTGETKDVLEALAAYAEAKKDHLEAIQKYHVSLAELRRATGQP